MFAAKAGPSSASNRTSNWRAGALNARSPSVFQAYRDFPYPYLVSLRLQTHLKSVAHSPVSRPSTWGRNEILPTVRAAPPCTLLNWRSHPRARAGNSMALPLKRRIEKSLGSLFDPLYLFYLLVDDIKSWRYFPKWFSSFRPVRALVGEAKPWVPFEATDWLEHYLKPDMRVFEYGSGGSTIFFAQRVAEVISIEHDKSGMPGIKSVGSTRHSQLHIQTPRAETYCRDSLAALGAPGTSASLAIDESQNSRFIYDDYYAGTTVHEYVQAIDVHPDHTFDLVLVDGRVRTECMQHAIPKIGPAATLCWTTPITPM